MYQEQLTTFFQNFCFVRLNFSGLTYLAFKVYLISLGCSWEERHLKISSEIREIFQIPGSWDKRGSHRSWEIKLLKFSFFPWCLQKVTLAKQLGGQRSAYAREHKSRHRQSLFPFHTWGPRCILHKLLVAWKTWQCPLQNWNAYFT